MIQIYKYVFLSCLCASLIACNNPMKQEKDKQFEKLEKASWLIGSWENSSEEGLSIEKWKRESDSTYSGESYFVIGKDTVFSEKISLIQSDNKLYYIPTVNNQNNGQSIKFALSSSTENKIVFENSKHDFPQKIEYKLITSDSLVAQVSVKIDGKMKVETFPMKKVK